VNLANKITISRILVIPIILAALHFQHPMIAFVLFLIACLSDYLDGWLARNRNMVSQLGILLDPIADKILVCFLLLYFTAQQENSLPYLLTALLIAREFYISGLRSFLGKHSIIVSASKTAKWKTATQFIALGLCFFTQYSFPYFSVYKLALVCFALSVFLSLYSAIEYTIRYRATILK